MKEINYKTKKEVNKSVFVISGGKVVSPVSIVSASEKKKNKGCTGCSRRKSLGRV